LAGGQHGRRAVRRLPPEALTQSHTLAPLLLTGLFSLALISSSKELPSLSLDFSVDSLPPTDPKPLPALPVCVERRGPLSPPPALPFETISVRVVTGLRSRISYLPSLTPAVPVLILLPLLSGLFSSGRVFR